MASKAVNPAPETLMLAIDGNATVRLGVVPKYKLDNFYARATLVGNLINVSRIACSPDGELFCVRGTDLYRGPIPTNKDVDWFSVSRRVGKSDWGKFKKIFFHPNGDLYGTTSDGKFYKGPKPDNENLSWLCEQSTLIGDGSWDLFEALFFDLEGVLYGVYHDDRLLKGNPPSYASMNWLSSATTIGEGGWLKFTHFNAFDSDEKMWCVNKDNGDIYRGSIPEDGKYLDNAEYLGWNYTVFPLISFTVDKIIHNIVSFSFLPEKGERVSESAEIIKVEIADNRRSSSILKYNFTVNKTIKQSSTFTHKQGFTDQLGAELTFEAGIPGIAGDGRTIEVDLDTTHKWRFANINKTSISFSSSAVAEVRPGEAVRMVASVMKAELHVPYRARVQTVFGSETEMGGIWKGVAHYNLMVTQEDYDQ